MVVTDEQNEIQWPLFVNVKKINPPLLLSVLFYLITLSNCRCYLNIAVLFMKLAKQEFSFKYVEDWNIRQSILFLIVRFVFLKSFWLRVVIRGCAARTKTAPMLRKQEISPTDSTFFKLTVF